MRRYFEAHPAFQDPLLSIKRAEPQETKHDRKGLKRMTGTMKSGPLGILDLDPLSTPDPLSFSLDATTPIPNQDEDFNKNNSKDVLDKWSLLRKKSLKESVDGEIEQSRFLMIQNWNSGFRESAVKILIKCLQNLSQTSISSLTTRFFQTVDLIMSFRTALDSRLKRAGNNPDEDKAELVDNWYVRITTIKEFTPRYYLEAMLMSLEHFNNYFHNQNERTRFRLTLKAFGDPYLGIYAAAYLVKMLALKGAVGEDYLLIYNDCNSRLSGLFTSQVVGYEGTLKTPLDWIIGNLMIHIPGRMVMNLLQVGSKHHHQTLILQGVLCNVNKDLVFEEAARLVDLSLKFGDHQVLSALGIALIKAGKALKNPKDILKLVWGSIDDFALAEFVVCLVPWAEFVALHFGTRSLNTVLTDFIRREKQEDSENNFSKEVDNMIRSIITWISVGDLLEMTSLNPSMSLVKDDIWKLDLYIKMLGEVKASGVLCRSASTIQILLNMAKFVGSSVSALTPHDQERQISDLVIASIYASSLSRPEKQLQYLTECRAAFSHLDLVQITLIREVNKLSAATSQSERSLQQAMAAYAFITIPSVRSLRVRLNLYLTSAQLAFQKGCISQGESCIQECFRSIQKLPELDTDEAVWFKSLACNLFSTLLVVPDNPENCPLSFVKEAVLAVNQVKFIKHTVIKELLLIDEIKLLRAVGTEEYPYGFHGLAGNNQLQAGDQVFHNNLRDLQQQLSAVLHQQLQKYKVNQQTEACKEIMKCAAGKGISV